MSRRQHRALGSENQFGRGYRFTTAPTGPAAAGRSHRTKAPLKPWFAYFDSKLDIILFSLELQRRLERSGSSVRSMIDHPGIAKTNLVSHVGGVSGWMNGLAQPLLNEAENGALPTLFAVTGDILGNSYLGPDSFGSTSGYPAVRKLSSAARNPKSAAGLWEATDVIAARVFNNFDK